MARGADEGGKLYHRNKDSTKTYTERYVKKLKASHQKIFPMQGLWSDKKLLKSTNQEMGVSENEQISLAKELPKHHYKKMYEQKEYMEEWLKFKEVIAGMKK